MNGLTLNVARVHENSNLGSHRFGWQVGPELSPDNATVPMRASNFSPDASVVRTLLLDLGLVDVSQALPAVPSYLFLGVHALDLDQRRVLLLVRLRSLVT